MPAQPADAPAPHDDKFRREVEPYRRELLAHCYRMLGSLPDAEDAYQETLVRAWRGLARFEGRSSFRTWLHRIATNVCLDAIGDRAGRVMRRGEPAAPDAPIPPPVQDPIWLDPYPDEWVGDAVPGPEARFAARESITIAFMTAVQVLPARQRAVLLLRDVVGMSAEETAAALDSSVAAVNSALQRARATLDEGMPRRRPPLDAEATALLERYVRAWESGNLSLLLGVLRDDAILAMPPIDLWLVGAEAIVAFYTRLTPPGTTARVIATRASAAPAYAIYHPAGDGEAGAAGGGFRLAALVVLDIDGDRVAALNAFLVLPGSPISRAFGLPDELPA